MSLDIAPFSGTGADGFATVSGNLFYNRYASVNGSQGNIRLNVTRSRENDFELFTAGDLVLVVQMAGENKGMAEFNRIREKGSNFIDMAVPLSHTYDDEFATTNRAQAIKVPDFAGMSSTSGSLLFAPEYSNGLGGLLVLAVRGKFLNKVSSTVEADGFVIVCGDFENHGNFTIGDGSGDSNGTNAFIKSRTVILEDEEATSSFVVNGATFGIGLAGEAIDANEPRILVQSCSEIVGNPTPSGGQYYQSSVGGHKWCASNVLIFF